MINGHFKDEVTLYTVTESVSTDTWENIKTNSAGVTMLVKIRPLTNSERFYQNKNNLEVTHRMYSSYSTAFDHVDRIGYGGNTYEIQGMTNPFSTNRFLQTDLRLVS